MRKTYRLFGIPVWTVETTEETATEEPDEQVSEGALSVYLAPPTEQQPPFGFTPIPFYWDE